jgi:hypothetical protein
MSTGSSPGAASGPPAGFPFGGTAQRLLWPALPAALRA